VAAVERLRARGAATSICTNKPEKLAIDLIDRLSLTHLFDALVGADTLPVRKPDPAPYPRCGGAQRRHAGAVASGWRHGDGPQDGSGGGVPCVLVTFGPSGRAVADLAPEALLDHYDDLDRVIATVLLPGDLPRDLDRRWPGTEGTPMEKPVFKGSFTQQEPIPEAAIEAAVAVMRTGRLHRYNLVGDEIGEVSRLEEEFAAFTGAKYCLAVASGGYAMSCALRAIGVGHGDKVLSNGFTLAPVPGAIASVGGEPVFVETTEALTIDIDDLAGKARASGARVLLLSHMRGHICDMDRLMQVCDGRRYPGDRGLRAHDGCGMERNALGAARAGGLLLHADLQAHQFRRGRADHVGRSRPDGPRDCFVGKLHAFGRHTARPPVDRFENVKLERPTSPAGWTICGPRSCVCSWPTSRRRWTAGTRSIVRSKPGLRNVPGPADHRT
jgi:hypothetical protein